MAMNGLKMSDSMPGGGMDPDYVRSRILFAAALLVALVYFLGALVPLWIPLCAALAVFLCQRHFPDAAIAPGQGARIGLRMGALAFVAVLAFTAVGIGLEHFAMHHSVLAEFKTDMQNAITQSSGDPQVKQMMSDWMKGGGFGALMAMVGVVLFFMFLALGAAGGAVQALILRKPRS